MSRASEQLMHLKVSTQLKQQFYEKYYVDSEDSGHRYARIKFAELVTEGERKVSMWKRKLQELEFHERQASFLQTSSVGTHAVLYQTSRKGRRKQVHPQRTRKKAVIKRTSESDRADGAALQESLSDADSQRTEMQEKAPTKIIDAVTFWDTLAAQSCVARSGSDENALQILEDVTRSAQNSQTATMLTGLLTILGSLVVTRKSLWKRQARMQNSCYRTS